MASDRSPNPARGSYFRTLIDKLKHKFELNTKVDWIRAGLKSALLLLFLAYSVQQSIDLLITYYSNSVEINLEIHRPENLTLPSISICFVYYHNFGESPPQTVGDYLKLTPKFEDLFQNCTVLHETKFEHVSCTEVSKVQTSINRKYKCFTLFRANAMLGNKKFISYPLKTIKSLEWLNIKLKNLSMVQDVVGIAVHNNSDDVHPDLSDQSYVEVIRYWYDDGRVSRVTFTYSASALSLLPEPFTSKCIDYTKLNVQSSGPINLTTESQKNFLESCVAQKYEKRHSGIFPMTVFATESDSKFKVKYKENSSNMTREDYAVDEKVKCREEYPFPQCYSVTYAMKIKTTAYENSPEEMELVLYPPTGNQINLNEVPRHEFREVIAMISGIFSFWIGISVVSVITPLIPFFISFVSRCKKSTTPPNPAPNFRQHEKDFWIGRSRMDSHKSRRGSNSSNSLFSGSSRDTNSRTRFAFTSRRKESWTNDPVTISTRKLYRQRNQNGNSIYIPYYKNSVAMGY